MDKPWGFRSMTRYPAWTPPAFDKLPSCWLPHPLDPGRLRHKCIERHRQVHPNGRRQSSRIFRGGGNSRLERAERGYREHCSPTMTLAIRAPVHQSKKVIAMTQRTMPEAIIKSSAAS